MTTAIKERPILFSGPMVRAILEGRKTQMRRLVKLPKISHPVNAIYYQDTPDEGRPGWYAGNIYGCSAAGDPTECWNETPIRCPYGAPGDRLWVREAFITCGRRRKSDGTNERRSLVYKLTADERGFGVRKPWQSPIRMPRWASRITLSITEVRAQRLQGITFTDIRSEGVNCPEHDFPGGFCCSECASLRTAFSELWNSINSKRAPWSSNPWVWAITFKRLP